MHDLTSMLGIVFQSLLRKKIELAMEFVNPHITYTKS